MEENSQQFSLADEEETLVAPRFDEEETIIAQPVVPLEGGASVAALRRARGRRPWPLALVLISALVGSVLGGAALYLYQTRASASNAHETSNTAQEVAPTAPSPEAQAEPSPAEPVESAATTAPAVETPSVESSAKQDEAGKKETPGESGASSANERRKASDEGAGAPKHGKKGDDEPQAAQNEQRPRRIVNDTQEPIPDDRSPAAARARRVEEGLRRADRIRERRRQRRENAARPANSIEGIFEGQPPQ